MVLPAPTQVFARKVRSLGDRDIHFTGGTIGGGPISEAVKAHLSRGNRVVASAEAALTFNYDLDAVRAMGVKIDPSFTQDTFETIELKEIDIEFLMKVAIKYEVFRKLDYVVFAVQDHGKASKEVSAVEYRHRLMADLIGKDPRPVGFLYDASNIPGALLRMKSVAEGVKKSFDGRVYGTDTVIAATVGASLDPQVKGDRRIVTVDVGNSHTFAALLIDKEIAGYFEMHTSALTPDKLQRFIEQLMNGTLTHEQILREGGHGAHITDRCRKPVDSIVVTGPRREIMAETSLKYRLGNPLGDNLMTGAAGLLHLLGQKEKLRPMLE